MELENRREDETEEALNENIEADEALKGLAEKNEPDISELEETDIPESEEAPKEKKPPLFDSLFTWVELFAVYFSIGILLILCFFGHSYVDGDSMNNSLFNNDMLIISKFNYTPKNGDIIVCQSSEDYGLEKPLVKRVIALAGQEVHIDYINWKVTVDGITLDESYVNFEEGKIMNPSNYLQETFTVPEGKVFVMGDNRNHSLDSRSEVIGFIDERYILGKVAVKIYPFSEFELY